MKFRPGIWIVLAMCSLVVLGAPEESFAQNQPPGGLPQERGFVLQRFRPSFDPNSTYNASSGQTMKQWEFIVGAWLNFGYRPLTVVGKGAPQDLVKWQLGADIGGGISFLDVKWAGIELYLSLPILIYSDGRVPNTINCGLEGEPACVFNPMPTSGLGDFGLAVKYRLLDQRWQPINLAFVGAITIPTGAKDALYGSLGIGAELTLAVSRKLFERWNLVGNLGFRVRQPRNFLGVSVRNELIYRVGTTVDAVPNFLDIVLEVAGGIGLENVNANNIPLELLGGLRFFPLRQKTLAIDVGGGVGIVPGFGIPTFRVFLGISYHRRDLGPPDVDDDGIPDPDDKCPNQPGPKSNDGCPLDTDKDGIIDIRDRCPKVPGPRANGGCPYGDTDKDGVTDNEDSCPTTPGHPDNNGCPYGDKDGDGLKDNVDQCPNEKGPKANHGCPDKDRDNDTVIDRLDNCPDIPGPPANKGCPKKVLVKVNRKTGRILLLEKVYFATARATIRRRSYPVLAQVIAVMRSNPKIKIRIEGHTDNRGGKSYNLGLSRRRAASVKRYLIRKGNVDSSRLSSQGFGLARPIAPNSTSAGRAKNRRVEFHIVK